MPLITVAGQGLKTPEFPHIIHQAEVSEYRNVIKNNCSSYGHTPRFQVLWHAEYFQPSNQEIVLGKLIFHHFRT